MNEDTAKKVMKILNSHEEFSCKIGGLKTEPHVEVFHKSEDNQRCFYNHELAVILGVADAFDLLYFIHMTWDFKTDKDVISALLH